MIFRPSRDLALFIVMGRFSRVMREARPQQWFTQDFEVSRPAPLSSANVFHAQGGMVAELKFVCRFR